MPVQYVEMTPEEKVTKVLCLTDNLFFNRYFFKKTYNRKFVLNEHHEIICRALELVYCGYVTRLKINIAPRYGKSELAVKGFIANGLAINPASKYIHLSYGDAIALENSQFIKELIQTDYYQNLFPKVKLKKDTKAKDKWYTTENGGVLARAAGGQVTGFGAGEVQSEEDVEEWLAEQENDPLPNYVIQDYIWKGIKHPELDLSWSRRKKFAGAIVIDDPIKPEDADQDTIREKVNSRYDSTIRNRANSRSTPIIVIMQRLHPNDLCGYLDRDDEQDNWLTISMPCIKEDGSALWPHKETIEELKRQEKANELVFQRQKQQNPQPKTGLMFPRSDLNWFSFDDELLERLQDADHTYFPVDPANEGGDFFAAGPAKLIGNRIYIPQMIFNTDGTDLNEPRTVRMIKEHKAYNVGVEGVMGWQETANRIRNELAVTFPDAELRVLRPRTNKHTRISNRQSFIRNHFWFWEGYRDDPQYAAFIENLITYKKVQEPGKRNKHDDAPDWCEMAANYFEKNFPDLW